MPTEKKVQEVAEIAELLRNASLAVLTDYRGLSVADLQRLRTELRPHESEFRVMKNTLAGLAADQVGLSDIRPLLEGPTAMVIATAEPVASAKIVNDFVRTSKILKVKGAVLEGQMIPVEDIERLASLPPREILLGKVMAGIQTPLYGLVGVLSGTIRSLAYVLQARADQLGGTTEEAA
ncbi:50S ribosomal protein L10 [Nitrolancea hollandica]|uniref:Large ribosomal subunit protein uL10 n=1 Tax=Nitrolancea hollandica Lb TaxID=1129897 RepID=I4ENA0_9BACT|nr:50S ribosomal protein L10 [Nitrolancea hollandica]CCF86163.1 50S ribosomal protein L10 [Nitrolancea hollandica Lb]